MATYASATREGGAAAAPIGASLHDSTDPVIVNAIEYFSKTAKIHPTKVTEGEELPEGFLRSYGGFLLNNVQKVITVNQQAVRKEEAYLQQHVLLAYFVGGRPASYLLDQWTSALQRQIGGWTAVGRNLGRGFFQLQVKDPGMLQKLLMLSPFKSKWGTCVMQGWMPNFDAANPKGMLVPTWITLRRVPDEFQCVADQIAQGIGKVLGGDRQNSTLTDQRFCVALPAGAGWVPSLIVENAVG